MPVKPARRTNSHDCDVAMSRDAWAMSGFRQPGDRWTCRRCGTVYEHACDEAEGCCWLRVQTEVARAG